jgi:hypothetical protein
MSTSPLSPEDIRAAAEVYQELGPEYSDAVVASFLDKVEREVAARVDTRLAAVPRAAAVSSDSRRMLIKGVAIGVTVSAVALLALIVIQARHVAQAAATPVPHAAGGSVTQVISRSTSDSFGWLLLVLVAAAICGVAAVRVRRQPTSRRMVGGRG